MLDSVRDDKESRVSKVESLEQEIRKLFPQELAELVKWLQGYDAELWDRQTSELSAEGLELSEDDLKGAGLTAEEIAASPKIGAWADDDIESGADPEAQKQLWQAWIEKGPQGPIEEDDEPELP